MIVKGLKCKNKRKKKILRKKGSFVLIPSKIHSNKPLNTPLKAFNLKLFLLFLKVLKMADKKNNWKTPLGAIKLIFIVAKVVNKIVFYEFLKVKTYILNYLGDMDENLKR